MTYNMKFIKATEAKRLTDKATQELIEESLENILESLSEEIENSAEEGYDELVYEIEEPRLVSSLVTYLQEQGYNVTHNLEDEENSEHLVVNWEKSLENVWKG